MDIYIDGSTTITCIIFGDETPIVKHALDGHTVTVNEGEYLALIWALNEAKRRNLTDLKVFSDSQLLVRQLTGQYQTKALNLKFLNGIAKSLSLHFKSFTINWLPREQNPAGLYLDKVKTTARRLLRGAVEDDSGERRYLDIQHRG